MSKKIFIGTKSNSNYKVKYAVCWDVEELENFFKNVKDGSIMLNDYTEIYSLKTFVRVHLQFIKSNNGNLLYLPYYERLMELKSLID